MTKILYIFFFLSLFISCKKYPEGGLHAFARHKIERHEGSIVTPEVYWGLERFEVNGIDSTNFVISNNDQNIRKKYIWFFVASHNNYIGNWYSGAAYECQFENNKTNLFIYSISNTGSAVDLASDPNIKIRKVLTPNSSSCHWTILKLKKKEILLKSIVGNNTYVLELKRH